MKRARRIAEVVSWKEPERWEVGLVGGITGFRVWLEGREDGVESGSRRAGVGGHRSRWASLNLE